MQLNPSQHSASTFPPSPLLIIAGAGTGKTNTLAHRVAHLITEGADASRILLLTFTRRAAEIMVRRAERIVQQRAGSTEHGAGGKRGWRVPWSGTFHSIANRLLRLHASALSLDPRFTVLDRSDSADLLNVVRNDLGFPKLPARFPKKDTCLPIYSPAVDGREPVTSTLM